MRMKALLGFGELTYRVDCVSAHSVVVFVPAKAKVNSVIVDVSASTPRALEAKIANSFDRATVESTYLSCVLLISSKHIKLVSKSQGTAVVYPSIFAEHEKKIVRVILK